MTLQCVQVKDAPAAIVRSSVRPSENVRVTTMICTAWGIVEGRKEEVLSRFCNGEGPGNLVLDGGVLPTKKWSVLARFSDRTGRVATESVRYGHCAYGSCMESSATGGRCVCNAIRAARGCGHCGHADLISARWKVCLSCRTLFNS
jgi:hypothetical protein